MNQGYAVPYSVAEAAPAVRAEFIRKTYFHVAYAVLALIAIESLLISSSFAAPLIQWMMGARHTWLIVIGLYIAASWIAQKWAHSDTSRGMQYMGLGLYVTIISIVFLPICYIAKNYYPNAITQAGIMTGVLFVALTVIAFTTKKDFSFMGGILKMGFIIALGLIATSLLFGFDLGLIFSGAMVLLLGISILYHTSQIMFHYRTDQHVAASLGLFASLATLFYYILHIVMSMSSSD
jgi:FtsH-binding integral membrane protein